MQNDSFSRMSSGRFVFYRKNCRKRQYLFYTNCQISRRTNQLAWKWKEPAQPPLSSVRLDHRQACGSRRHRSAKSSTCTFMNHDCMLHVAHRLLHVALASHVDMYSHRMSHITVACRMYVVCIVRMVLEWCLTSSECIVLTSTSVAMSISSDYTSRS